MPVPLLTWTKATIATVPTTTVAGCLSGLKAAVDAHNAANPTTAFWVVSDYSAPNGTLVLKPTAAGIAAGGTADARIIFFGGSAPNLAAVDGISNTATPLYCGLATSAGVDAPQQAYTAGAPFTTGVYIGGAVLNAFSSVDRVTYWESFDGLVVAFHRNAMTSTSTNLGNFIVGKLLVDPDGETARWFVTGSLTLWNGSNDSSASTQGVAIPASSSVAAAAARANALIEPSAIIRTFRTLQAGAAGNLAAARSAGNARYFFPIIMRASESLTTVGKLRQIAYGIQEIFGQTVSTVDGVAAHKLGSRSDVIDDGPWICNFRV